mgnify:CR=1 FL=1
MAAQRDSNMELLRLVAMLLVLVVHANYRAIPVPTGLEIACEPLFSMFRLSVVSSSVIAVNVFVLLSGWYGIKPRLSRVASLLFQILFFILIIIAWCAVFSPTHLQPVSLIWNRLILAGEWDYWFVKSYLMLYLLAPVLNTYIEHSDSKHFGLLLVCFFIFQSIYGWWYADAATWFKGGYSPVSFIGLYMLARYARLYPNRLWTMPRRFDLIVYFTSVILLTSVVYIMCSYNKSVAFMYMYSNPIIIIMALHVILFFSKLQFTSRAVNRLATSAFAIYLVNSSSFISKDFYDKIIHNWFNNEPHFEFIIYSAALIVATFVVSILLDKVRIVMWQPFAKLINSKLYTR